MRLVIANKREWNNCFLKFSKSLVVRKTSEKSEKIQAKAKKLDEDGMLCNTLRSDRHRLITKTFRALIQTFH